MTPERVAGILAGSGVWTYSRASGPGGQRRDHTETRAEFTLTAGDLDGLPDAVGARVREGLGLDRRPLRLKSQAQRSRERNREVVMARLTARVAGALAPPAPERRPTRPGRGARERRLADKARRAQVKAARRPPDPD